jgi:hypothetical protein
MEITLPFIQEKIVGRNKVVSGIFKDFKVQDNHLFLSFLFHGKEIMFDLSKELTKQIISFNFSQEPRGEIFLWEETEDEWHSSRADIGYKIERYRLPTRVNYCIQAYTTDLGLFPCCVVATLKDSDFIQKLPEGFIPVEQPKPVVQEEKPAQPKKSALPATKKLLPDTKEKEIDSLKRQLFIAQQKLEDTQEELSKLKEEKSEEGIESKSLDEFFADETLDDELEKKVLAGFMEDTVFQQDYEKDVKKSSFERSKKQAKDLMWEILKESEGKRITEENLTHLLVNLKWKTTELNCELELLETMLKKSEEQNKKLSDDIVTLKKELEDVKVERDTRKGQISKIIKMPVEVLEEISREPSEKGYKIIESMYEIMKCLEIYGKMSWGQLEKKLIRERRAFSSKDTLSRNLNALQLENVGMVFKDKDKNYQLTEKGKEVVKSHDGIT